MGTNDAEQVLNGLFDVMALAPRNFEDAADYCKRIWETGYDAGTRANARDRWVAVEDYVALLAKCEAVVTAWTDEWDCSRSSPHTGLEKAVDELSAILTTLRPQEGGENAS